MEIKQFVSLLHLSGIKMGSIVAKGSFYEVIIPVRSPHIVTSEDIEFARKSWQNIINDQTQAYTEMKSHQNFNASSCITWFYDW